MPMAFTFMEKEKEILMSLTSDDATDKAVQERTLIMTLLAT